MSAIIKTYHMKKTRSDVIFDCVNYSVMTLVLLIVLLPLLYIVSCSFSSGKAVMAGRVWILPVDFSFDAYKAVFEYQAIWMGYANTILYTAFGTSFCVCMTLLAAYPLSRKDFSMRRTYMRLFTFTMLFGGGLIPWYMVIRDLGILNTFWAMILPSGLSVWNVIITRSFFEQTIAGELREAACIDGCSDFGFFRRIVLPLSGAIIAVNGLFYAVGKWNAYFDALILINDSDKMPLQIILRRILVINTVDKQMTVSASSEAARASLRELIKYALIIVSSAPVLCAYPFVQKYFVKGLMIGSVKG